MARECYQAVLVVKENHTWMIKEKEEEKVVALEIVELVDGEPTKTIRIGTTLSEEMKSNSLKAIWTFSHGVMRICQA